MVGFSERVPPLRVAALIDKRASEVVPGTGMAGMQRDGPPGRRLGLGHEAHHSERVRQVGPCVRVTIVLGNGLAVGPRGRFVVANPLQRVSLVVQHD